MFLSDRAGLHKPGISLSRPALAKISPASCRPAGPGRLGTLEILSVVSLFYSKQHTNRIYLYDSVSE